MAAVRRKEVALEQNRLSLLTAGPETGLPVVLIHGIPAGAELWRDVISRLGDAGFLAMAPDLPGYGETRIADGGDYSLAGAAALLAAWLDAQEIRPVWLISHDIGGGVAEILSVHHPSRVSHLTFSNAIVGDSWPVTPIKLFRLIAGMGAYNPLAASGWLRVDPYFKWQLKKTLAHPEKLKEKDFLPRIFFDTKMTDPAGRAAFVRHLGALSNAQTLAVEPELKQLTLPTLLLWGMKDPFQSWTGPGKRLAAHFNHAHVKLLEDAGHFLMLDDPETYAAALIDWYGETVAG